MNIVKVTAICSISVPGVPTRTFQVDEEVSPTSPYYWSLIWSGHSTDTGVEYSEDVVKVIPLNEVVISSENPGMSTGGIWIQTFPNGDWTMWIEE